MNSLSSMAFCANGGKHNTHQKIRKSRTTSETTDIRTHTRTHTRTQANIQTKTETTYVLHLHSIHTMKDRTDSEKLKERYELN